jgi:hypothetical protein
MKELFLAVTASLLLSAPALAGGMDNAIGNTVRVVTPETSWDAHFMVDGSFTDTRGVAGTWTFDSQLCLQIMTENGNQNVCGPWNETAAAGDSWNTTGWSDDGSEITLSIIAPN